MDMTAINGSQAVIAGSTGATTGTNQTMGKDQFLKLLIAQLANQDPLEPVPNTEFVAQLATFSSLEQLIGVNSGLASLEAGQTNLVNSQALNLIGKKALVAGDGTLRISAGSPESISYSLPEGTTQATLTVSDAEGTTVRVLQLDPSARTCTNLVWDGNDENGNPLPNGEYQIDAKVTGTEGKALEASLYQTLTIDGVSFQGGTVSLVSGDQTVPFDMILEIRAGLS